MRGSCGGTADQKNMLSGGEGRPARGTMTWEDDMAKSVLGIVGGSGLYHIPALQNVRWEAIKSPWGEPSDHVLFAELDGLPIRFLPRHGRGHKVPPSAINYRANI